MRTVGELSRLTGVTVRTLHHYDEIGLLRPSGRSPAGYRLYDYADMERLQEILVWRALRFSLAEIQAVLDEPGHDREAALRHQRELVERDLERLGATARALDRALAAYERGTKMKETEMFEGFDASEYEDEARERWGHTEAYRESARRAAGYGEREWSAIRAQGDEIVGDFASLMAAGEAPEAEAARAVAERHRQQITHWFYPVSVAMHRNLAEMYVSDPRFAANYERVAEGLTAYVHDAILANADAQESAVRR